MESVFDGGDGAVITPDFEAWEAAYPNPSDRMDAICRNLIAHDGVFVIDDIPKPRRKAAKR